MINFFKYNVLFDTVFGKNGIQRIGIAEVAPYGYFKI